MKEFSSHPDPFMERKEYWLLDGEWDFSLSSDGSRIYDKTISVPFSPETERSGINRKIGPDDVLWYRKKVDIGRPLGDNERLLLHFDSVDHDAQIYIDGVKASEHSGGYLPFSLVIGKPEFLIEARCTDPQDTRPIARGKQSLKGGGIWYTAQSGIWKSVWLESVPETYISSLSITPDCSGFSIKARLSDGKPCKAEVEVDGRTHRIDTETEQRIEIENPRLWSPEDPYLYGITVRCGRDEVKSYTGLRSIGIDAVSKRITLNGKPIFCHGVLDQGYWKESLLTPPSDQAMIDDIGFAKSLGFNTIRKHIKIEPRRWYYHADRLGILVWQDMVSGGGRYNALATKAPLFAGSFLKDTHYSLFARKDKDERKAWESMMMETISYLRPHPSIILWTLFNEGWGQFDSSRMLKKAESADPSRLFDAASGWHDQGDNPFLSRHVYFVPYRFRKDRKGRPVILSEFGGYGLSLERTERRAFSYKRLESEEDLTSAIENLYRSQIIPAMRKGLTAAIYTQLSDVEQEENGLISFDRKRTKIIPERIRELSHEILD